MFAPETRRSGSRPLAVRLALAAVLLSVAFSASGCSWLFPPEPQGPERVQDFIKMQRPGQPDKKDKS